MCGFFAISFKDEHKELGKILFNAGKRLLYRGYDTAGVAVVKENGSLEIRKDAGKLDELNERLKFTEMKGKKGIIQLRWATFGTPEEKNAQPHTDCKNTLIGAHNGNIVNTPELREKLIKKGHKFKGENDGEVILHLVEDYYHGNLLEAVKKACKDIDGDYAFIIGDSQKNEFVSVKKGSTLFLGIGDKSHCIGSDLSAIYDITERIKRIEDGEIVVFTYDRHEIYDLKTGERVEREPENIKLKRHEMDKGAYAHYFIKEINQIPDVAENYMFYLDKAKELKYFIDKLKDARNVYFVGAGSSYYAGILGSYFLSRVARVRSSAVPASEFNELIAPVVTRDDLVLFISQSGETKDVKNVFDILPHGMEKFALVNNTASTLAIKSDITIPVRAGLEIAVPATKTFINEVLFFLYTALKISPDPELFESLKALPDTFKNVIKDRELVLPLAEELKDKGDGFTLGYGMMYGTALEASLKIKEVIYKQYEGFYSGEFKHGPLSCIEPDTPALFLSNRIDKHFVLSHINEILTRKGAIYTIAPYDASLKKVSRVFIPLPDDHPYILPVLGIIPVYILVYETALQMNYNPDFPRNISKTITVD